MNGTILIRLTGVITCMAAITAGWDAEAGWRRRCCTPTCCAPVYSSCDPCATSCCGGVVVSEVVVSEVTAPARCCASTGRETIAVSTIAAARPQDAGTIATAEARPLPVSVVAKTGSAKPIK